jgi:hypothetical protein
MPRVVTFFGDAAARAGDYARAAEEARPRVASVNVANGATNVDPALAEIVVRFDRAMDRCCFGVNDIAGAPSPKMGKGSFDESGRVFTIPVTLEPDKEYGFTLNWPGGDVFRSAEGVVLSPVEVRFRTRPRP